MSIKELYRDDLLNRYANHTFTETVVQSMTLVEFKNGSNVVIAQCKKLDVDDAYKNIRFNLVGNNDVIPILTTTQRDALTGIDKGQLLYDITTGFLQTYSGSAWSQ